LSLRSTQSSKFSRKHRRWNIEHRTCCTAAASQGIRVFQTEDWAQLMGFSEMDVRGLRKKHNIVPVYKIVDTCAAEFAAFTPIFIQPMNGHSTRHRSQWARGQGAGNNSELRSLNSELFSDCEANPTDRQKVIILGSGPNRIGQGLNSITAASTQYLPLENSGTKP